MTWTLILKDGFEGDFEDYWGIGELTVPVGWIPLWSQGHAPGVNVRPECDREVERVRSNHVAAKMFSTHASHTGAFARRVQVEAGTLIRAVASLEISPSWSGSSTHAFCRESSRCACRVFSQ